MIHTVNEYEFRNKFANSDTCKDNFTDDALIALFGYLEQLEEDLGEQFEFNMLALCWEWSEYENLEELQQNYQDIKTLEDLQEKTEVIEFKGGMLIRSF